MMRYTLLSLLLIPAMALNAQMFDPIDLEVQSIQTGEDTYDLIFTLDIEDGWNTYSQNLSEEEEMMGPFPTSITFTETGKGFDRLSEYAEECGAMETKYDEVFGMELTKLFNGAVLIQSIRQSEATAIKGYVTLMSCDDTKCLPAEDYNFSVDLSESPEAPNYDKDKACQGESLGLGTIEKDDPSNIDDEGPGDAWEEPLEWSFQIEDGNEEGQFELIATASIEEGWKVYGRHDYGYDGPIVTDMYFDSVSLEQVDTLGSPAVESKHLKKGVDEVFQMELTTIKKSITLRQKVYSESGKEVVKGFVEFQTCDDVQCLPPTQVPFEFDLGKGLAYNPEETDKDFGTQGEGTPVFADLDHSLDNSSCTDREGEEDEDEGQSFFWIFFAGFLGGFVALLTPCVFPMIPLTVSFFTKSSKDRASGIRNALVYGGSIIIIYVALGLLVTSVFGADALNLLSTNAVFNIFFFVLFIVFALSFFGLFEITLPSSWVNQTDKAADKGGLVGIFFMAFTLSLVSFSCTGPIIGTLLVETATGGGPVILGSIPAGPLVGMLGFSVALALPFGLFAAFPSWLNSLPQSGSWMNSVKVLLGFVEVALAFKFLSIADLTMGWKFLPYELFVVVWLLCALGIAAYFFGWLKFPLDYSRPKMTRTRAVIGALFLIVGGYIASGFTYSERNETFATPLMLSGLAPPAGHSYIFPSKCPLSLDCFKDFETGRKYAKKVDKPILLDFTGHGCVNCRKMEDRVWGEPEVYELINEDYVLISLYVDERTPLKESYTSAFDQREKRTIGNKWSDFQSIHFKRNSQPFYVLMSPEGKILNQPVAYTPDVSKYKAFLECGLTRYQNLSQE